MRESRSKPLTRATLAALVAVGMGLSSASAQTHKMAPTLAIIGAPVFSSDGLKIGQVADASAQGGGMLEKLRITTEAPLGFGPRTVEIARETFKIEGGAVVLEFSAEDLRGLPSLSESNAAAAR
jgi:hypothetical protein